MNNEFDELEILFNDANDLSVELNQNILKYDAELTETKRVQEIAANIEGYINEIDEAFCKKTKLTKSDVAFLTVATGLQILRQYALSPNERLTDQEAATEAHKHNQELNDKLFGEVDPTNSKKYYYASMGDILDSSRYVPYDITNGSKQFNLGGLGKGIGSDHRFKVPGHDPILGLFYGTANILTNTITTYPQLSYHVKKIERNGKSTPTIYAQASTIKVFDKVKDRFINDKPALVAALIKQMYHIASDEFSKMGIPLPFIGALSPDLANKLAQYGLDWIATKQATVAAMIDFIIASVHGILYTGTTDMDLKLYKIRTKKILDYSGIIASSSNLVYVAISTAAGDANSLNRLDIGGILYTILKLLRDRKYMADVKKEFLDQMLDKLIAGEE